MAISIDRDSPISIPKCAWHYLFIAVAIRVKTTPANCVIWLKSSPPNGRRSLASVALQGVRPLLPMQQMPPKPTFTSVRACYGDGYNNERYTFSIAKLMHSITTIWNTLLTNRVWMTWNLFLALFPLALSLWLFDRPRSRSIRWGIVGLTAVMFVGTYIKYPSYLVKMVLEVFQNIRPIYLAIAVFLTLVLMGIEMWMLGKNKSRSLFWWLGIVVFMAFLPNAPYVLTDIIHLIEDIRRGYSVWLITLVLIPQYILFVGIGFQAYVLSLMNLGQYMTRQGWGRFVLATELSIHGLCAIGIYLGRFWRFNSWDLITRLDTVLQRMANELLDKRPLMILSITFAVLMGLYYILKWVTESIIIARQVKKMPSFEMSASSLPE